MIEDGFYFNPKRWLGDANVIAMDWDCRAMHLHLMAIAWQQEKKGFLIYDEQLLLKILNRLKDDDWDNRIKPQIMKSWKKKILSENGKNIEYIFQPGLVKNEAIKKRTRKIITKNNETVNGDEVLFDGFNLKLILKENINTTILYQSPKEEEKSTIWNLGVQLLSSQTTESKARSFLAKMIKQYGEKSVAQTIADISIKNTKPVQLESFIVGILKKKATENTINNKSTTTGVVI